MSLASVVESAVMATDTAAFASIASSIYGDLPVSGAFLNIYTSDPFAISSETYQLCAHFSLCHHLPRLTLRIQPNPIQSILQGLLSSYSAELASIPTSLAYLETSINGVLASASSLISQYGTVGAESFLIAQATSEFGMLAGSGTDGLGGVMGGMTAGAATATGQVASVSRSDCLL